MKTLILISFCSIILSFCVTETFAQKTTENVFATQAVRSFYRFHTTHDDLFNEKQVALRKKFFTPKLQHFFAAELKRQVIYSKRNPNNKPYFEGLPFQPIEFCPDGYKVGNAQINRQKAIIKVSFVYAKSSCTAKDGTKILIKYHF